jgi:hypothetical protein
VDDQERVSSSDLLTYVLRIPIGQQKTADAMRLSTVMQRQQDLLSAQAPRILSLVEANNFAGAKMVVVV